MEQWREGVNLWSPSAEAVAMESVVKVVERWIRLTGADGKA